VRAPSFSSAAAGDFFIYHGEKIVVALVGGFALVMVWWGVSASQSQAVDASRTPAAIAGLSRQAAAAIEASERVTDDRVSPPAQLAPRLNPWRPGQVKLANAPATSLVLSSPIDPERRKRTKPDVFPMSDLRAVAGVAVFADADAQARGGIVRPQESEFVPPRESPKPKPPKRRGADQPAEGTGAIAPVMPEIVPDEPIRPGRIAPFVVVTGLIPSAKQQAEFESRYRNVSFRDPRRDSPRWSEYRVERMKVAPVEPGSQPAWKVLPLVNVTRFAADGDGQPRVPAAGGDQLLARETLPPGFFLQPGETDLAYAVSLPERVDNGWGEEAIHPWFVPQIRDLLEARSQAKKEDEEVAEVALADLAAKPLGFVGKQVRLAGVTLDLEGQLQRNVGLSKFGVRTTDPKFAVEPTKVIGDAKVLVFAGSEDLQTKLAFDVDDGKSRPCNLLVRVDLVAKTPVARLLEIDLLGKGGGGEVTATRRESSPEPVVIEGDSAFGGGEMPQDQQGFIGARAANRIFRFVDLNVEPGAEYRYRVRFAIRNPNAGLAVQHVADVAVTKGTFLLADYSNETSPVRIPDDTRVVARMMPRDAARKLKVRGDNVEVMVLARSEATGGNFGLRSVVITPGGEANVEPSLNRPGDKRHYGEPVTTDRLLVDVRGGQEERVESRNPQPTEPLEMLLIKPNGEFEFVTAADSEPLIRTYRSSLFRPGDDTPRDDAAPRMNAP